MVVQLERRALSPWSTRPAELERDNSDNKSSYGSVTKRIVNMWKGFGRWNVSVGGQESQSRTNRRSGVL